MTLTQARGAIVTSVHLHRPSLEDVFLHFTGSTIREREASVAERNRMMIGIRRR